MFNHAPDAYICPFCLFVRGVQNEHVLSIPSDVVFSNAVVTALIASHQWPNNPGHVLIIPNRHFENIFDLPLGVATQIHRVARHIAIAMKDVYGCHGISTRQHNEPAGDQEVWHYHLHLFPRYKDDNLYTGVKTFMSPKERAVYAHRLRSRL